MARKSKFSEAEIIGAIKEIEGGATSTETARKFGVSINTMQRWRAKFGGMTVSEAQEKQLVAQYALENDAMKAALGKKW